MKVTMEETVLIRMPVRLRFENEAARQVALDALRANYVPHIRVSGVGLTVGSYEIEGVKEGFEIIEPTPSEPVSEGK